MRPGAARRSRRRRRRPWSGCGTARQFGYSGWRSRSLIEVHEDLRHFGIQLLHGWEGGRVVVVSQHLGVDWRLLLPGPGIEIELDPGQCGVEGPALPVDDHAGIIPSEASQSKSLTVDSLEFLEAGTQRNLWSHLPLTLVAPENDSAGASSADGVLPDNLCAPEAVTGIEHRTRCGLALSQFDPNALDHGGAIPLPELDFARARGKRAA